jgi:hypothetical protein
MLPAPTIRTVSPDDGSSKHLWNIGKLLLDQPHGTTQKTAIFILAAMKT